MENLRFSNKREEMNVEYIHAYLTQSYWNKGISIEKIKKCIETSLNFGLFLNDQQIGYARVLTDFVRFSYLMDVFIDPLYQGKGYGKLLMKFVLEDDEISKLPAMMLATKDAHGLYEQLGFRRFTDADKARFMILRK